MKPRFLSLKLSSAVSLALVAFMLTGLAPSANFARQEQGSNAAGQQQQQGRGAAATNQFEPLAYR